MVDENTAEPSKMEGEYNLSGLQDALESGLAEEQKKAAELEASLAHAQAGLRKAEADRQALQAGLEEQQENLYNQVSHLIYAFHAQLHQQAVRNLSNCTKVHDIYADRHSESYTDA